VDLAAAYEDTHRHLRDLVAGLAPQDLGRTVPASPDWTVKDVVAHVTGVAGDLVRGRIPEGLDLTAALSDPQHATRREVLTAEQVASRKDASLQDVLAEWNGHVERLLPMLRGERPFPDGSPMFADAILVTDLSVHAQDVRNAVGAPGDRDSVGAGVTLASYGAALRLRLAMAGLPALLLRYGGRERLIGQGEPGAVLCGDRYEILRALSGRRSTDQIRAMDWTGDPEPYLPLIPPYGERTDPLTE